jgi:N-formylglutamate amidohydrolase
MNAFDPAPALAEEHDGTAPFEIAWPTAGARSTPLVFSSPHSGRDYPPALLAASRLDAHALRRSEDAHVDALIAGAPACGAVVIRARYARAWLDVNREPWELDPAMFEDELPAFARGRTPRVAAGLGSIARSVGEGQDIYRGKLTFAQARARVEAVHQPYHEALSALVGHARRAHGTAWLIDWHSMPAAAARLNARSSCDIVLGDRFGASCAPALPRLVEGTLQDLGYTVARNIPYAGGYTTERYGAPSRRVHALQIELNRALYMDEDSLAPNAGFERLQGDLQTLFGALAEADWPAA